MIIQYVPILNKLADSPLTFHPIGSRYLGFNSPSADYDFLLSLDNPWGEDKDEAKAFLEELGFEEMKFGGYGYGADPDLRSHFRYKDDDCKVDVLIFSEKDAAVRLKAFKNMKAQAGDCEYVKHLWQSLRGNARAYKGLYLLLEEDESQKDAQ